MNAAAGSGGEPIRIVVHGTGRMAKAIAASVETEIRTDVALLALVGPQPPDWKTDIAWCSRLDELPAPPDLLIDFTLPQGTLAAAHWCGAQGVALLSGVTGLSGEIHAALRSAAGAVPVLWSPNLSLGVNLLAQLAGQAAAILDAGVPVLIEDIHHQWKKDAPSGTALMLGAAVSEQRQGDDSAIRYHSVREGEVIGEHTVTFRLAGEEFDLRHRAHDRSIYARGALAAGKWLVAQPAGFYSARDWLAIR